MKTNSHPKRSLSGAEGTLRGNLPLLAVLCAVTVSGFSSPTVAAAPAARSVSAILKEYREEFFNPVFDDQLPGRPLVEGRFSARSVTDDRLAVVTNFSALRKLTLHMCSVTDVGLVHLRGLTNLQTLQINSAPKIHGEGFRHFQKLQNLEFLSVAIGAGPVAGKNLKHLSGLMRLRTLQLSLENSGPELGRLNTLTNLLELELYDTSVRDKDIAHLRGLTTLESLALGGMELSDDALAHLTRLSRLKSLFLQSAGITGRGLEHLQSATNLQVLQLRFCGISNSGLQALKHVPSVEKLLLDGTQITDDGLEHLGHLRQLRLLTLTFNEIEGSGMDHLSKLRNLEELSLSAVTGDSGLKGIRDLPKLKLLEAKKTRITDKGLEHLKNLSSLRTLLLTETEVGDRGLAHLASLTQLETLDLRETRVTDAGLKHLSGLTSLTSLNVERTKVTAAGIRALRAELPGLLVED